ncbi:hypothetical protein BDZ94DRAFT_1230104 [Collybia nuda]|uniref:Uncharacterized protein n=1 Tax=Collybia nuda TaxID=64659 RepID=A0A9P5XV96_9AGAR|nr:hypothetical protein BDZ94DRAFT_1230104 [Collybia nuda]
MHTTPPIFKDVVLPLTIFPVLSALAFHYILRHMNQTGLDAKLTDGCNPLFDGHVTPYLIQYTGIKGLDGHGLCPLVTFFHAAIATPDALSFLTYFVGVAAPLAIIPAVEGWREGRSLFIAFPVLFGILCQTLTVGVTMPIYWMLFIITGGASSTRATEATKNPVVSQGHAEAIIFGVVVGAVIPSVAMLVLEDPHVTAIWQPYPVYVTIAQYAHLAIRPASKHSKSGYPTIRALYIGAFIICSSVHFSSIWPIVGDRNKLMTVFLPSLTSPDPSTDVGHKVLHFLKWDMFFGFASFTLATLWFAGGAAHLLLLSIWIMFGTPLIGPGAVVMGAFLWRESCLQIQVVEKPKKA